MRWQYFAGVPLKDGPVLTKDLIYQFVPGGGLIAIDKTEPPSAGFIRSHRWADPSAVQFLAEDDKYSYVRTTANSVAALDKKTGEKKFESQRPDLAAFGTNTKDNVIYAATKGGRVMAVVPVLQTGVVGELVMAPVTHEAVVIVR